MRVEEIGNIVNPRMNSYPAVVAAVMFLEIAEWIYVGC